VLNRLYERGLIEDPVNKTKSVTFTEEGLRECERLFNQHFVIPERPKT
jgi:Mn-dependent DtxR family transcriptional regulator